MSPAWEPTFLINSIQCLENKTRNEFNVSHGLSFSKSRWFFRWMHGWRSHSSTSITWAKTVSTYFFLGDQPSWHITSLSLRAEFVNGCCIWGGGAEGCGVQLHLRIWENAAELGLPPLKVLQSGKTSWMLETWIEKNVHSFSPTPTRCSQHLCLNRLSKNM